MVISFIDNGNHKITRATRGLNANVIEVNFHGIGGHKFFDNLSKY